MKLNQCRESQQRKLQDRLKSEFLYHSFISSVTLHCFSQVKFSSVLKFWLWSITLLKLYVDIYYLINGAVNAKFYNLCVEFCWKLVTKSPKVIKWLWVIKKNSRIKILEYFFIWYWHINNIVTNFIKTLKLKQSLMALGTRSTTLQWNFCYPTCLLWNGLY